MPDLTNRRKTSMADIAKAADVSEATVDRVLNGRGGVSREKERRVLEWARKLKIDRALDAVSVRWLRIAILLQQPVAPYYVYLKQGFEIAQKAFEAQRVICAVTYFDNLEPARVVETINRATQKADALIIVAYEHPDITAALRQVSRAMPVVTLASDLPGTGRLAYVGIDNRGAGRVAGELMGRFLGDAGGKVLVMTGMHDFLGHEERESGFRSVLGGVSLTATSWRRSRAASNRRSPKASLATPSGAIRTCAGSTTFRSATKASARRSRRSTAFVRQCSSATNSTTSRGAYSLKERSTPCSTRTRPPKQCVPLKSSCGTIIGIPAWRCRSRFQSRCCCAKTFRSATKR